MELSQGGETGASAAPFELVVIVGDTMTVERLPLEGAVTIGRGDDCDVRILNGSVSRRHARLHLGPPLQIEDLGSVNGTFMADRAATGGSRTRPLQRFSKQTLEIGVGVRFHVGSTTIAVRRAAAASERPPPARSGGAAATDGAVVLAPAMRALYEQARRAAASRLSVLVLGETGVGKEVLAHTVHRFSLRAAGPFLELSCAALSPALVEGELFGYEKGAFTGALTSRPGLLETAEGGTVFLDEIGELPLPIQVKLLRVLEDRKVLRVGARVPRSIDVRFVAATNRDLEKAVQEGTFREDLFFRLNGITLTIPPLRERLPEIAPLAEAFAARAAGELNRPCPRISLEALAVLHRHVWPGNVRELRNVMERAVVLCADDVVLPEDLPAKMTGAAGGPVAVGARAADSPVAVAAGNADEERVAERHKEPPPDRAKLEALLAAHRGVVADVARAMQRSRKQVYRWIAEQGLEVDRFRG